MLFLIKTRILSEKDRHRSDLERRYVLSRRSAKQSPVFSPELGRTLTANAKRRFRRVKSFAKYQPSGLK